MTNKQKFLRLLELGVKHPDTLQPWQPWNYIGLYDAPYRPESGTEDALVADSATITIMRCIRRARKQS